RRVVERLGQDGRRADEDHEQQRQRVRRGEREHEDGGHLDDRRAHDDRSRIASLVRVREVERRAQRADAARDEQERVAERPGPMTCESCRVVELKLTAERSRSRPTMEWMSVCCAGPPIAPAKPWTSSSPKIHQTVTMPDRVAAATPNAATMSSSCAAIWTFR